MNNKIKSDIVRKLLILKLLCLGGVTSTNNRKVPAKFCRYTASAVSFSAADSAAETAAWR